MRKLLIILIIGLMLVPTTFGGWNVFSPESPPPLNFVKWIIQPPWFIGIGNNLSFNESHLVQFIAGQINDTHIIGTPPWLYDDFTNMYFNETKLNETVDDRVMLGDTNTHVQGDGIFLTNDSTTMFFNSLLLNQTIDGRDTLKNLSCNDNEIAKWNSGANEWECASDNFEADTDTHVQGDTYYLYNDSTTMYLNETKLNQTINQSVIDNSLWYVNQHNDLSPQNNRNVNMTDRNITDVDTIFVHNISGRSPVGILNESGHLMAQFSDTNYPSYGNDFGDLILRTLTVDRLIIIGLLNYSVIEPPNYWNSDETWIHEDNFTFYFNETKLNQTISGTVNDTKIWLQNSSGIYEITPADVFIEGNLSVSGSGHFGNNSVYIGSVKITQDADGGLNISNTTYSPHFIGEGSGLFNLSINQTNGSLIVNGPLVVLGNLNMTNHNITDLDCLLFDDGTIQCTAPTQKDGQGYLYNDSTTIYLNETLLNNTIISIADIKAYETIQNITVVGGTGIGVFPKLDYLITQITVIAPTTPTMFRFEAVEGSDGDYIDRNRRPHLNVWNIYKSHSINDTINVSITSATNDGQYSVRFKYIDNVVQV